MGKDDDFHGKGTECCLFKSEDEKEFRKKVINAELLAWLAYGTKVM